VARWRVASRKVLKLPADIAGETIVRGVERRKAPVLVGSDAKVVSLIERVAPVSYWKLIAWLKPK